MQPVNSWTGECTQGTYFCLKAWVHCLFVLDKGLSTQDYHIPYSQKGTV